MQSFTPKNHNPLHLVGLGTNRISTVQTSTEIVAKKVWHRGDQFRARDIFDLALVAEKEPAALVSITPVLRDRRAVVSAWIATNESALRDDFANLETLEYRRTFDECLAIMQDAFRRAK